MNDYEILFLSCSVMINVTLNYCALEAVICLTCVSTPRITVSDNSKQNGKHKRNVFFNVFFGLISKSHHFFVMQSQYAQYGRIQVIHQRVYKLRKRMEGIDLQKETQRNLVLTKLQCAFIQNLKIIKERASSMERFKYEGGGALQTGLKISLQFWNTTDCFKVKLCCY